jgi:TPP-dependent 2-oxoacid decarboxylase
VGGLSLVNAAAGGYSDDLPMLLISGGPNTNDSHQRHIIHHVKNYYHYEMSMIYNIFHYVNIDYR